MSGGVTYVTDTMREAQGKWGENRTSPPITETDIRRWSIATFYPEKPPRIYWDPEYAATTRWGGIIAPPDFNPFAWSFDRGPSARLSMRGQRPDGSAVTGMNGGQTDTYGVPMRPGDAITERSRLIGWWEHEGRLGHTLFVRSEVEWRNQHNEHVRTRLSIGVRF